MRSTALPFLRCFVFHLLFPIVSKNSSRNVTLHSFVFHSQTQINVLPFPALGRTPKEYLEEKRMFFSRKILRAIKIKCSAILPVFV